MPTVSSYATTEDTITITGINFFTSSYTAKFSYAGVTADSVTIDSATQVTATFTNGVPLSYATLPVLWFESSTDAHWAINTVTLVNNPTVSGLNDNVECSFAGGCLISISQLGITSAFSSSNTSLTVCGSKATFSSADSTSHTASLILPPLITSKSVELFGLSNVQNIQGVAFSSSNSPA